MIKILLLLFTKAGSITPIYVIEFEAHPMDFVEGQCVINWRIEEEDRSPTKIGV